MSYNPETKSRKFWIKKFWILPAQHPALFCELQQHLSTQTLPHQLPQLRSLPMAQRSATSTQLNLTSLAAPTQQPTDGLGMETERERREEVEGSRKPSPGTGAGSCLCPMGGLRRWMGAQSPAAETLKWEARAKRKTRSRRSENRARQCVPWDVQRREEKPDRTSLYCCGHLPPSDGRSNAQNWFRILNTGGT